MVVVRSIAPESPWEHSAASWYHVRFLRLGDARLELAVRPCVVYHKTQFSNQFRTPSCVQGVESRWKRAYGQRDAIITSTLR